MSADNIEKLYKYFEILESAKDKISEHEAEYLAILDAVKGEEKEKRLASQFIARLFKHFPKYADRAIGAQFDLCEDNDVAIRKQATKDLPAFCRDNKEYTNKIASILAQLLQSSDAMELAVVQNSLMAVIRSDAKGAFAGIFDQILNGEDLIRERCIKFLASKVKQLGSDVLTKEIEDQLIQDCKKVLQDVTCEEFHTLMSVLSSTRLGRTVSGNQQLVDIVAEQSELDGNFEINNSTDEDDHVERLTQCLAIALPYFSAQVDSSRFVAFICDKVLPVFGDLASAKEAATTPPAASEVQLDMLKALAELITHCRVLTTPAKRAHSVYKLLLEYMPPPPDCDTAADSPSLQFSHVECLLYSYHALMRMASSKTTDTKTTTGTTAAAPATPAVTTPGTEDEEQQQTPPQLEGDALKDFRTRLQYFARGVQAYIKILKDALKGKTDAELKSEENHLKVAALRTTSNINTLIKDLFHSPPSYKSQITLSWITPGSRKQKKLEMDDSTITAASTENNSTGSLKRHTPITFESSPTKQMRNGSAANNNGNNKRNLSRGGGGHPGSNGQKMYTPPSGKYSTKVTSYAPSSNSFGGRGGRGSRGGGRFFRGSRGGGFRSRGAFRSGY